MTVLFHPEGTALLTCGHRDCSRWPLEFDDAARTLRVGPPERLLPEDLVKDRYTERRAALSADGSRLVVADQQRARIDVLSLTDPSLRREIVGLSNLAGMVLSPDGRWAVGLTWPSPMGRIWDAVTGTVVKGVLGPRPIAGAAFSPDGRRLFVGSDRGGEVLEVGTWKRIGAIPPGATGAGCALPTVSADGRVLAVTRRQNREIQLLDAATLRELARLVPADPQPITHLAFSADGRRLAAACTTHVGQVWDLSRIRARLRDVNLDWDHPAYPEAPASDEAEWRVQVVGKAPAQK
jgi:WD40 repeat protein